MGRHNEKTSSRRHALKVAWVVCFLWANSLSLPTVARAEWQVFRLPNARNTFAYVSEDPSGNLWVGTLGGGVSRFDGLSWRTYTTADGLVDNNVRSMLVDRSGNAWCGTYLGVSRFDGTTWRTFTTADGLAAGLVLSILEDRSGNLWFGTTDGISRYDGVSWKSYSPADGLASFQVFSMVEDSVGNLWFGTAGGLSRFDGTTWRTYTTADGLVNNSVQSICEDHSGSLWFGTGGGVSRFDGTSWRTFTTADGLAADHVRSILEDRSGNLWFGTDQGVSRFDGRSWTNYTTADGVAHRVVLSSLQDRLGNLWFGTFDGVSRFDGTSWKNFTTTDGLANNSVLSTHEDSSGDFWFATGGGVSRFNGTSWSTYTTADGLADNLVHSILEDRSRNFWFGTNQGVSRFDGTTWRTYTTADSIASNYVNCILEDRSGNIWLGGASNSVSRFDGVSWRLYTVEGMAVYGGIWSILEDHAGNLWFGTSGFGVSRYDGVTWKAFTTADGLAEEGVSTMVEDHSGNLWFAANFLAGAGVGVTRFDGVSWRTYTVADGLASPYVLSAVEDRSGKLWFGTELGVSQFDGTSWSTLTSVNGLANVVVTSTYEDRSGNLWFGTDGLGVSRYEPDRVPPKTVFLNVPPAVTSTGNLSATFIAAYGEADGIEYSYALDGEPWSAWAPLGAWTGTGLADGSHTLKARSRDNALNVDPFPAVAPFVVDATPPAPTVASPTFGQAIRGTAVLRGTTADARFLADSVWVRPAGAATWAPPVATLLGHSSTPVSNGDLASWDTSSLADGGYDLRLAVTDSLGLTGTALVSVIVDNHSPFSDVTAPAKVAAATGGDVFTTNSETHLYFPPHAFAQDALVSIVPLAADAVPASLPSGGVKVLNGYEIRWTGAVRKPARLTMSYAGVTLPAGVLALYRSADGTTWERRGGTLDAGNKSLSLAISLPGRYALFTDNGVGSGTASLSDLAFTPRVFSPAGGFADQQVGISFRLGRAAPVTVTVFSRSGRLIREVVRGQELGAGDNLIRWDGRDRNGGFVVDGIYLVTVEALGRTETEPLAVVK